MIATIRAEWRKNRFRPAFLVGTGLIGAMTVLAYGVNWYLAHHPGSSDHPVSILTLYPDQFVNNVIGAGFPLGAAMAIVIGAIYSGSEFGWGTLKTMFTQSPGRLTVWAGRVVVFAAWMLIVTLVLFVLGAISSVVVAFFEGHAVTWPAAIDVAKGICAIWLIFVVNGALGMALGVLIKQSAAALGLGLVYLLTVEVLVVRFIDALNGGAFKWIGNLFVDQNAAALLQSFVPVPVGKSLPISAEQAVIVMAAYLVGLVVVAAGFLRLRDVT
jgi:ABC-type transport system involved in multi-copper enzyme maturation permease subunit